MHFLFIFIFEIFPKNGTKPPTESQYTN